MIVSVASICSFVPMQVESNVDNTLNSFVTVSSFALDLMPSFVERINGPDDFEKFKEKATKYGLPMMLSFSFDRQVMNELKYLSTEFRRRVLIAHISFTKTENKEIFYKYGVRGQSLMVEDPTDTDSGESGQYAVTFDGKWNLHRLTSFFSEHALESEVTPKPITDDKASVDKKKKDATEKTEKVKTEKATSDKKEKDATETTERVETEL